MYYDGSRLNINVHGTVYIGGADGHVTLLIIFIATSEVPLVVDCCIGTLYVKAD